MSQVDTMSKKKPTRFGKFSVLHPLQHHPFVVPVVTLVVLALVTSVFFVGFDPKLDPPTDSKIVEFSMAGERRTIPTRAQTVEEFLKNIDIELGEHDIVEPAADSKIYNDKFHINVYRARPVTIVEESGQRKFAYSAAVTPRSVAKQAGVTVYPEDRISLTVPDNFLREGVLGEKVVIERSTPANINLYGQHVAVRTHAQTVGDLLKEKNIEVRDDKEVKPSLDTPVTGNIQIFVVRPGTQLATVQEEIPMPLETVDDPRLSFGVRVVRQEGAPGRRVVTYQIILDDKGKEIGRKKIQQIIAVEPVKQVEARGKAFDVSNDKAGVMAAAGISPADYPYVDFIVSRESGWRPTATNGRTWGLCQALPGSKMASAGADWETNPVTQLRWCSSYASGKGGWKASYDFWQVNHWW